MNFINKNFLFNPDFDEPSACFFLNVDEERNLLIGAPFYTNQTELIRAIAKSLPVGYKLYVKEHLSQVRREWRKISEYKEMMNIPNVRLLHPSSSAEKIYENSSLIISIAGTPSFEAAFYNKPSIIFADYDFNSIPSIYRVKSFEELPQIIRSALNKKYDPKFLNEYVSKLAENTFDFDYQEFQSNELDFFFFGGNLVDVEIKEEKMKQFLKENKSNLQKVTDEHVKKIKQFQEVLESEKL